MEEPLTEELATHGDPESCVDAREGIGEALTGARVGEVWNREIIPSGRRRGSGLGRQHDQVRCRERLGGPARSETLRMHEKLHAREPGDLSRPPARDGALGRIGEAEP